MASKKSQKALLQKLDEYGNSIVDDNNSAKTSRNHNSRNESETVQDNQIASNSHVTPIKNKKKKLNKKQRRILKNQSHGDIVKSNKTPQMNRKMKWLKEAIGSDGAFEVSQKQKQKSQLRENEETKSKRKKEVEVVVFEDPTRKKKQNMQTGDSGEITSTGSSGEFDMRSARFEVRKLGISGFAGEQKSDARVSLLINLGAKPPRKKSYINYKEFQKKRKEELDAEKQKSQDERTPGEKMVKTKKKPRAKPDFGVDGLIGRYKDGVQYINKDVLKKLKKS